MIEHEERLQASQMARWSEKQWREWYGAQADHVERVADRSKPGVRHTLSWVLPWLRSVQTGGEDPVLPPKLKRGRRPPANVNPGLEVEGAVRPRLSLRPGKKAPAKPGLEAVK